MRKFVICVLEGFKCHGKKQSKIGGERVPCGWADCRIQWDGHPWVSLSGEGGWYQLELIAEQVSHLEDEASVQRPQCRNIVIVSQWETSRRWVGLKRSAQGEAVSCEVSRVIAQLPDTVHQPLSLVQGTYNGNLCLEIAFGVFEKHRCVTKTKYIWKADMEWIKESSA